MTKTLSCPFFTPEYGAECCADRAAYGPSAFEREEYCSSTRYVICPLYCNSAGGRYPAAAGAALSRRKSA